MPVLTIAAQNAVEREYLGVATSSVTLFRQIGGSIGVSIFGAIFVNRLATEVAQPPRAGRRADDHRPRDDPRARRRRSASRTSPASRPRSSPVFLVAAVFTLAALVIAWLLPEVPLRETSHAAVRAAKAREDTAPDGSAR